MRLRPVSIVACLALGFAAAGRAQEPAPAATLSIAAVARAFAHPSDEGRVLVRWWWFGPSVSRDEIDAEMRRMKEGGLGGFELAVVYPMTLDVPASGLRNEAYLSPEFLDQVRFAAARARELGLRMDLTLGSGWSFGGPYITSDLASARLRSDRREIAPTVATLTRPVPFEGDRLVAAFIGPGSLPEADPAAFREIDIGGDGPIRLPAGEGPRVVLFYYASHSGQLVKRAAVGAEGYVLDHYQRAAVEAHLREAGEKLLEAAGPSAVHAVFCDSLEAYDADWTSDLLAEFHSRRGYDLRPLLPRLELDTADRAAGLRRDYGRTLSELFDERFLVPVHEWARRHSVLFRIQDYGEPPATLASAREADLADGEGWKFRELTPSRWASSANHLLGRPVTTSETWTWLHSPAFRATPLDVKAEADQHFLSGVNQLIGHGWPYSPPPAGTPGWPFYAAAVLSDKNPWWPVMPDLAASLQRVSAMLRQGEPVTDVALYAPTEDAWASFRPGVSLNLFRKIVELIGPTVVPAILDSGHAFDLVDDGTLAAAARRYKVIVLPGVRFVPEPTRGVLEEYTRAGGAVVAVRRRPEGDWPALDLVSEADLGARLSAVIAPDMAIAPATPEIGFVHRRLADADVYFLAHTGNAPRHVQVRFRAASASLEEWDPLTGRSRGLVSRDGALDLDFEPYGSRIVVFRRDAGTAAPPRAPVVESGSVELRSGWTLTVPGGTGTRAVDLPHSWSEDALLRYFSGAVSYRRTVSPPPSFAAKGTRVFLDFGEGHPTAPEPLPGGTLRGNSFAALLAPPIREAATVFVNGRRVGSVWAPPYRVEVTDLLHPGANDLRVEVYNTAINRLAEGGHLPDMTAVVERYGQRARLQDLDGLRPLPSGLLSVPRLVAEE